LSPLIKGDNGVQTTVTWEEALQSIDLRLKQVRDESGGNSILGFGSPSATNEGLFLFKRYLQEQMGATQFEFRLDSEDKKVIDEEDQILRHFDKHPNSMGAIKLGLTSDDLEGIDGAIRAARAGRIKAGVVIYFNPLVRRPSDDEAEGRIVELLDELKYSVVLAAHKAEWHASADVVLPVATWSEEEGTYTNFEGRVQYAAKAIESAGEALPVWEVFAMLIHASGSESRWMSAENVFATMAEQSPAYKGISIEQTQLPGIVLASS
jgi:predicted molibdopterin-dependent oxidoreductase YjgC